MMHEFGNLAECSIIDVIRSIYVERLTGVLEVEHDEGRKRFDFVAGDLHLSGTHPLARRLAGVLDHRSRYAEGVPSDGALPNEEFRSELQHLVQRIVAMLVKLDDGVYRFSTDPEDLPLDLVGPLPTAYLVMEGTVHNLNEVQMLRSLGGEQARLVANHDPGIMNRLYEIDPQEMFLLSRAEEPTKVAALLRQVALPRELVLRTLCRFKAIGLVERPDGEEALKAEVREEAGASATDRFLKRIRQSLAERPVDLATDQHRSKLGELLVKVGAMSHYELLEVGFHATVDEVHEAYHRVAGLVHPDHAARLGLRGKDGGLYVLFERVTQAYLTLVDRELRAKYDKEAGIVAEDAEQIRHLRERDTEERDLARGHYERAMELFAAEDFHFALELARQAARIDPQAEYFALEGEIQAKNPHWVNGAIESYRQAVKLEPKNVEYHLSLGRLWEQTGNLARARSEYRATLQIFPHHDEATQALARVGERDAAPSRSSRGGNAVEGKGLFGRLKGWFGG